ncbi:hypothetical protein C9374_011468 [Naegleria lovaniensis]|uniref:Uncharacterized protein n=1 Tax=Naegleria lovaniensis TaxID=51637 RepID=A0AA88H0Z3_NAELO|nr:uncharacterized protein C9374_011468 [Naegleria lovaniensis]KAG2392743.1 hypothetical protein C9374_011468 [Naegleria lovaniensis]
MSLLTADDLFQRLDSHLSNGRRFKSTTKLAIHHKGESGNPFAMGVRKSLNANSNNNTDLAPLKVLSGGSTLMALSKETKSSNTTTTTTDDVKSPVGTSVPFKRGISSRLMSSMTSRSKLNVVDLMSDTMSEASSVFSSSSDRLSMMSEFGKSMFKKLKKQAQKEVNESEFLQLNDVVDQMMTCGFPVIIFDRNCTIEYLNPEAENEFGMRTFAVLGEHVSQLFVEETVIQIQDAVLQFLGSEELTEASLMMNQQEEELLITPYSELSRTEKLTRKQDLSIERMFRAKSTLTKKVFNCRTKIITVKKYGEIHFCAYMQKIKLSQDEEKEMANLALSETITENSIMPIVSSNEKGIIQIFNAAASTVFGYSKQEVLGKNVKMLCNPKHRKKHDYFMERYLKTKEKRMVDNVRFVKGESKSGESLKLEIKLSEIFTSGSTQPQFVAFFRDAKTMITKEEHLANIADKIYPKNIAQRLSMGQKVIDSLDICTLLFADIVGFTEMARGKKPDEVVKILHEMFGYFDDICYTNKTEKIKTIGDAYFLASGIPQADRYHAENCVKCGLQMIHSVQEFVQKHDFNLKVRIGIHTSNDIIAAVVGKVKRTYDLFGTGVAVTQLIEATGKVNQVHISNDCYVNLVSPELKDKFYPCFESCETLQHDKLGEVVIPQSTYITKL